MYIAIGINFFYFKINAMQNIGPAVTKDIFQR